MHFGQKTNFKQEERTNSAPMLSGTGTSRTGGYRKFPVSMHGATQQHSTSTKNEEMTVKIGVDSSSSSSSTTTTTTSSSSVRGGGAGSSTNIAGNLRSVAVSTSSTQRGEGARWHGLDLSRMGLKSISRKLSWYSHLTVLYLSHNKLTRVPGELFESLSALTLLDLSFNHLESLPKQIGSLINLERLSVVSNNISELPLEMGKLFKLKTLEINNNPIMSPPSNVLSQSTEAIIGYFRDCMPAPAPPPERKFISLIKNESYKGAHHKKRASIKLYAHNILADCYAPPERYPYCPQWALKWDYRKQVVMKEIEKYPSDVVCLQEVETGTFKEFLQPTMAELGYQGFFKPKSRAHIAGLSNKAKIDGCCIFYKSDKIKMVEQHVIEFQRLALSRHGKFKDDPSGHERLISRDNIALVGIFELDLAAATQSDSASSSSSGTQKFVVCNTHIHWDPELCDVKLMQTQLMLEELTTFCERHKDAQGKFPAIFVTGDFNSQPDSGVYDLLSSGSVKPDHGDFGPFKYGDYSKQGLSHDLNLASAYASVGEPEFTNYTHTYVGTLDYIWYSKSSVRVASVLEAVSKKIVQSQNYALPSPHFPSDHTSLCAELEFK